MSTSTRIRYTPIVTTTVKGSEGIDLHELLGSEGRDLLRHTLEDLTRRKNPLEGESAGALDWRRVAQGEGTCGDGATYELVIPRAALMGELSAAGIDSVKVQIRLDGALARVSREATGRSGQRLEIPVDLRSAIRVQANRAANMVIAHALSTKLKQGVREKNGVRMQEKLVNGLNIRMYAQVKG